MTETATPVTCYRHPDRETGLSCSDCGRPICTDCMTVAPVGLRCPDHAGGGRPQHRAGRAVRRVQRVPGAATDAFVTKMLIAANVVVFLANLAQGASLNQNGGDLFRDWALVGQASFDGFTLSGVGEGEWWRLITAAFLHGNLFHLGMNMLMLWWIGAPLELALGRVKFLLLYFVTALAGSAGALLLTDPRTLTVGASGAIFGILGAALVLERQGHYVLGGAALSIVVLNLVITFVFSQYISVGGHVGGLVGGMLGALAFSRFGRGHALYGRMDLVPIAGIVALGVLSIALAYWRVATYAT